MTLQFGILGPLEVREGDRLMTVRGNQQRRLLGMLLLHANQVVARDVLMEIVWGRDLPLTAAKALQMHVSQLRRLLDTGHAPGAEGELISTRAPGYKLSVAVDQVDLLRFEYLVDSAQAAADPFHRARGLREALRLWRGRPLADLGEADELRIYIDRLEDLHLRVLEDRIEADLQAGGAAEVVPELEAAVVKHPLRERPRAQLMLALYRAGRQAEALEVYRNARRTLVDTLGIETSRELRELERQILAQDPALDATPLADPIATELVGRGSELTTLLPIVDGAVAGSGAVVLIGGEPGTGKSRLAEALVQHAEGRGATVVVGRCWEAGGAPAYWPWVQALRAYVSECDPDVLRAQAGSDAAELATVMPELAWLAPEPPRPPPLDDAGARFRLFAAVANFLRRAADAQPLAMFLDDLHVGDEPSLLLLLYLAADVGRSRILIVGCHRETEARSPLARIMPSLARERSVRQVPLLGLTDVGTAAVLELTTGRPPPAELVRRVHAQTDGNPLFVVELGRLLASGFPDGERAGPFPIPAGVQAVILERIERLPEACRDLLDLASVVGREFRVATLRQLSDLDEDALFTALEEADDARLVGDVPEGGGALRFSHVLVRDALYGRLPAAWRMRWHGRIGSLLEARHAGNLEPHLAELAHHYRHAGAAEKAVEYATLAGDSATAQLAYEEAVRHYTNALDVLETRGTGDEAQTCELLLRLGQALGWSGSEQRAKEVLRRAAALAERAGRHDQLSRAALPYGAGWARASADPTLVPLLERALAAMGDEDVPARVRLLSRLATARCDDPRRARRVALAAQAMELATALGDPGTLAYALVGHWNATEGPDTAAEGPVIGEQVITLGEQTGDREMVRQGHDHRLYSFWTLADRAGIDVEFDAVLALTDELRQPTQWWMLGATRAMVALMEGEFDAAEGMIADTFALGDRAVSWNAAVSQRLALFALRHAQGRLGEIEALLARSLREYPALLRFSCVLAYVHAETGREAEAGDALDGLLVRDLDELLDTEWLLSLCLLADVSASLDHTRGAERLYALLSPYGDLYACSSAEASFGCVARALGVLAATAGRLDDSARHFEAAIHVELRMRARPWVAHAQHGLAAVLLARLGRGDRERADALAAEAGETYRALGMRTWAERAANLREGVRGSSSPAVRGGGG